MKMIINRLEKTFSNNLITPLENSFIDCCKDDSFCFMLKLVIKVLCHIFEHAPFFTSARWNLVNEDMQNIILSIQRFGITICKSQENYFVLEFLQLVKVVSDLELVVNQYIIPMSTTRILPVVKSKDDKPELYILSKSHGFLTPKQWKLIHEVVKNSFDPHLTQIWHNLLLQKYIKLDDQAIITKLIVDADVEWLWRNIGYLTASMSLKNLELFTEKLLYTIQNCSEHSFTHKLSTLNNISVLSNRPFRVAMNIQLFKHIDGIQNNNKSLLGKLTKLIYLIDVLEFEIQLSNDKQEAVNSMINALAEVTNKSLWEEPSLLTLSLEMTKHCTRLLQLMSLIHAYCFKTETKRIVFLLFLGVASDFRGEVDLLPNILDYLLGCLDDSSSIVPESLDRRTLLYWLAEVVPSAYPHKQKLLQTTLNKVVHSLDHGVEGMSQVFCNNEDLLCAVLQSFTLAYNNKKLKNKAEINLLMKQLISIALPILRTKKPKPRMIRLFTISLNTEFLISVEKSHLLSYLPEYLRILFKRLSEGNVIDPDATDLIDLVLNHKQEIDNDVVENVYSGITQELCKTDLCPILCYPLTVKTFLESLNNEQFEKVLLRIHEQHQKNLLESKATFTLSNVCEMWNIVVSAQVTKEKAKTRERLLVQVLFECQTLLEEDSTQYHLVIMQLLHSISLSKSITLSPKLLDLVLIILGNAPTDTEVHLLPDSLSVLSALINTKAELIFDRIPTFLQRLRKFIKSLVLQSPAENFEKLTFNSVSSSSINLITRIIKTITDHHSKHFARISPYLIADLLHMLVNHSIETSVKDELQNCVCNLLTICDHHGTQLLQSLLPIASIELFKIVSMTYKKSYKYTGKV